MAEVPKAMRSPEVARRLLEDGIPLNPQGVAEEGELVLEEEEGRHDLELGSKKLTSPSSQRLSSLEEGRGVGNQARGEQEGAVSRRDKSKSLSLGETGVAVRADSRADEDKSRPEGGARLEEQEL